MQAPKKKKKPAGKNGKNDGSNAQTAIDVSGSSTKSPAATPTQPKLKTLSPKKGSLNSWGLKILNFEQYSKGSSVKTYTLPNPNILINTQNS